MSPGQPYAGCVASLLTLHGKQEVIAPRFAQRLGLRVETDRGFDTDTLGTFTREVARAGTQRDAAMAKARLAAERSGHALGIGSEGSFLPGPFGVGFWNLELVAFVDLGRDIEVVGRAFEPARCQQAAIRTQAELARFSERAGFPSHALVLRAGDATAPVFAKGVTTWPELCDLFRIALGASPEGVWVESDLRAHLHPSRMANIARATDDLLLRLSACCPACETPGFGNVGVVGGLPCADCGSPTDQPRADLVGCVRCSLRREVPRPEPLLADPGRCAFCNP